MAEEASPTIHMVLGPQFLSACARTNPIRERHSFSQRRKRHQAFPSSSLDRETCTQLQHNRRRSDSTCRYSQSRHCDQFRGDACTTQRLGYGPSTSHHEALMRMVVPPFRCHRAGRGTNRQAQGMKYKGAPLRISRKR